MKEYTIAYKGLKNGLHDFEFEIGNALFAAYESEEVHDADCRARVTLNRSETQLRLDIAIEGEVTVTCDRCLEECVLPIACEGELLVKFSDEEHEYDGEVLWLYPGDAEVDLTQYLYESIILALPYQRVHEEGACNPEMLERFRIVTEGEFAQIEAQAEEEEQTKGSEWEKLAALKQQMEQED